MLHSEVTTIINGMQNTGISTGPPSMLKCSLQSIQIRFKFELSMGYDSIKSDSPDL